MSEENGVSSVQPITKCNLGRNFKPLLYIYFSLFLISLISMLLIAMFAM